MLEIYPVETDKDIGLVKRLLEEYLACRELEDSIFPQEVQAFQKQLSKLPAEFAEPSGCLLLAMYGELPAGCVGLRDLGDDICEMKRLYIRPEFRGLKIGRKLMESIIAEARRIGYFAIRGDTIPSMQVAQALYASLGFKEIGPYHYNPIEGVKFIELKLA